MQRTRIIFISILVAIGLGCTILVILFATSEDRARNKIIKDAKKDSESVTESKKKAFTNIDVDKYLELYKEDNKSVVLIGRSGCDFCKIAEPILQGLSHDYKFKIYYLSTDGFSDDDRTNLLNSDKYFKEKGGMPTPLLLIVGNSKIYDKVEGLISKDEYIQFLKDNKIIK